MAALCVPLVLTPRAIWAAEPKAAVGADQAASPEAELKVAREEPDPPKPRPRPRPRKFLLGLEGVAIQTPPIRPTVVRFDSRYLGNTTTLGGAGLLARYRVTPVLALDFNARSGSLRFLSEDNNETTSQDLVLGELGVALFAARGEFGQLAIGAGWGGIYNRIQYEHGPGREGIQHYGSGLIRLGIEVEILLQRVALVFSFRSYGVVTDRARVVARGAIFEGVSEAQRFAPVSTFQTFLAGSLGLAYRF